jgi:hypothetical protein
MRAIIFLSFLMIALSSAQSASAECNEVLEKAREFVRQHTVHHFSGDAPSQVEDTLALWETPTGTRRFSLCTVGPNYHTCFVEGSLESLPSDELLFELGNCKLTLKQNGDSFVLTVSPGWERVGEGGVCPRQVSCGAFGLVESGKFTPRQK